MLGFAQVKTEATDGYNAVQVGYQVVEERKITKPELNHLKKFGAPPMKQLREYRVSFCKDLRGLIPNSENYKVRRVHMEAWDGALDSLVCNECS